MKTAAVFALMLLATPVLAGPPTPPDTTLGQEVTPPAATQVVASWKAVIAAQAAQATALDALAPQLQNLVTDDTQMHQALDKAVALGNWWESYAKGLESQMKAPESK